MRQLLSFLTKPLRKDLPLFIFLIGVIALSNLYYWIHLDALNYGVYAFIGNTSTIYVILLFLSIFKGKFYNLIKYIIITWGIIWGIIDAFCFIELMMPFSTDFAAALRGTNLSESKEFINTFFSRRVVFHLIIIYTLSLAIAIIIKKKIKVLPYNIEILILLSIFTMAILTLRNQGCLKDNPLYKTKLLLSSYSNIDVNDLNYTFEVSNNNRHQPDNIIVIIGESFSSHHSSLYGYDKDTNPKLKELKDSFNLSVYNHANNQETSTIPAFISFMSYGAINHEKWFESPIIPIVYKKAGYNTFWISNQSKHGVFDNLTSIYSQTCDFSIFLGNAYAGMNRDIYDESLIYPIKNLKNKPINKNLYFVHLMGSHPDFSKRYPPSREKFTPKDYEDCIESQRSQLASYDNSILYNDSVVSEIMNIFKDEESIVVYFSDHGYDIFYSDPNYIGQARTTSQVSLKRGREIPFMVYMSPKFKEHFPEKVKYIEDEANKPFNTDSLINYLMHITDISIKE